MIRCSTVRPTGFHPASMSLPPPGRWVTNPPANNGAKVVISDTDHYSPGGTDALWAWKSFLRGHYPVLYDFGIIDLANRGEPPPGLPPYAAFEPARHAMGDTRRYAQKMNLLEMSPAGDLSSTGYALANPGSEYLVLQPASEAFTVRLAAGIYRVEWHSVKTRDFVEADKVTVGSLTNVSFTTPFRAMDPAVLYLKRIGF